MVNCRLCDSILTEDEAVDPRLDGTCSSCFEKAFSIYDDERPRDKYNWTVANSSGERLSWIYNGPGQEGEIIEFEGEKIILIKCLGNQEGFIMIPNLCYSCIHNPTCITETSVCCSAWRMAKMSSGNYYQLARLLGLVKTLAEFETGLGASGLCSEDYIRYLEDQAEESGL